MSSTYKAKDGTCAHFVTITVVGWADIFTRQLYQDFIIESLGYCREIKGLRIHAWVIMPNHLHLIVSARNENDLPGIMRDFKKYTSQHIIRTIEGNMKESRRQRWLELFTKSAAERHNVRQKQFWQHEYHPIRLETMEMLSERLNYLHQNPVKAGFVRRPEDFRLSSAAYYARTQEAEVLMPIDELEL